MPNTRCLEPFCPNAATYRGRCEAHASEREATTHPNREVYRSKRWQVARKKVLQRDGLTCYVCGGPGRQVDHVTPLSEGGAPYSLANLKVICATCHGRKSAREARNATY